MKLKAKLWVNKVSVEVNPFVEQFLARTTLGAVASLRGGGSVQSLELHQQKGDVKITVNGNELPLTPFPRDIICNTLIGLVSSLKGVDEVDNLDISIEVGG
ncbi:hypothetical protein M1O57_01585 [Dehalococcoidia bacterium]|nr:hypothetical protein [Dehalococcoidia bacterium]MCL0104284.1 hypothetical protein [Dehalococcoidia bacterium]